jgi:toxin-antitoxin system PIN domain toxin
MVVLDANILVYAFNKEAQERDICVAWLEATTHQGVSIGLPWVSLLAFLRIVTNSKSIPKPATIKQASDFIASLLVNENYTIIEAGQESFSIFSKLCVQVSITPKLFTDAYLASLALEQQATLVSADYDFARFVPLGLKWFNPVSGTNKK